MASRTWGSCSSRAGRIRAGDRPPGRSSRYSRVLPEVRRRPRVVRRPELEGREGAAVGVPRIAAPGGTVTADAGAVADLVDERDPSEVLPERDLGGGRPGGGVEERRRRDLPRGERVVRPARAVVARARDRPVLLGRRGNARAAPTVGVVLGDRARSGVTGLEGEHGRELTAGRPLEPVLVGVRGIGRIEREARGRVVEVHRRALAVRVIADEDLFAGRVTRPAGQLDRDPVPALHVQERGAVRAVEIEGRIQARVLVAVHGLDLPGDRGGDPVVVGGVRRPRLVRVELELEEALVEPGVRVGEGEPEPDRHVEVPLLVGRGPVDGEGDVPGDVPAAPREVRVELDPGLVVAVAPRDVLALGVGRAPPVGPESRAIGVVPGLVEAGGGRDERPSLRQRRARGVRGAGRDRRGSPGGGVGPWKVEIAEVYLGWDGCDRRPWCSALG